jgi:predicted choloylglycine hydrolase
MKLFVFSGSHREVGLALGQCFSREINEILAENKSLQERFLPFHRTAEGRRKYRDLVRLHKSRFPEYVSELEGLSQGAGVPFEELFLVNLRGEYEGYASESGNFGCSTCSVLTADKAIFGHNEDGPKIYRGRLQLIRFEIDGKPALSALLYPGFIPGNALGFNSEGISFSANDMKPKPITTGLARHFIGRSMFEAKSLDEAISLATSAGRASGFNFTIGSVRERRIVNIEVTPDNHHLSEIKGCFFHANHYIKHTGIKQAVTHSSQARQDRGEVLIRGDAIRDQEDILNVLRDRDNKEYPILRSGDSPDEGITLATGLFDLDGRTLVIYPGADASTDEITTPLVEIPLLD